ncbi:MAG: ribosome small subunit-dependent GTPase A [Rhodobacterales bacterium CG15_BIG_FIL_POST_REV_8_21_14_020_59_13]|nr:MAG: ribosome small subunit-dependent GTPase A [Rhodobacterales bacterium CG15_BIG_FIL_POST_REV_8_21_14_020_59_13]
MTAYTLEELGWRPAFLQSLDLDREPVDDIARISAVHRDTYEALSPQGELRLRPMPADTPVEDRPTVGDWVLVDTALERPARVLERQTLFARKAAGSGQDVQLIAANVDTAIIVSSCNDDFNLPRLERYLSLVREAGALPVIVLTKADLTDNPDDYAARARRIASDCAVETLNALDTDELAKLTEWVGKNRTLAFLGSSGVGKTTLLNALTGKDEAVSGIREGDGKGRHTTRGRSMHRMINGGWAIDLPGMRELALTGTPSGIESTFDDMLALAGQCRFSDCRHEQEPGCAVQAAIANGELDGDRLVRYRKLEKEVEHHDASLAQRHSRAKALGKHYRSVKQDRKSRR